MPADRPVLIELVTDPGAAAEIAFVAAVTFPLACPPHSTRENIAAHLAGSLTPEHFAHWITGDDHDVLVARDGRGGPLIGYSLIGYGPPADPAVRDALPGGRAVEVSKMYVLPDHHGTGRGARPSHLLMAAALDAGRARGAESAWLGVNQLNARALTYYRKMGFAVAGTRSFDMNGAVEHDYVMVRGL
ncbi:GNAT family N-acetyltransferase [Gordonia sp. FQ]|uniref:GNAT family N-acetyltransferase n=1 Tax=Gordonia sp. FQ TaxID=3446634 RepID=UPI003F865369